MKNEAEVRIKKKSNFSDIQQVWTTRRNPLPFWGQRQCWGYIGKVASGVVPGFKDNTSLFSQRF